MEESGTCGPVPKGGGEWAMAGVPHQHASTRRPEELKQGERRTRVEEQRQKARVGILKCA